MHVLISKHESAPSSCTLKK